MLYAKQDERWQLIANRMHINAYIDGRFLPKLGRERGTGKQNYLTCRLTGVERAPSM